jgi:hypothetical protein
MYYKFTKRNLKHYVENANYNVVAKTERSCSSYEGYLCEIQTKDRQYIAKFRVDRGLDFLTLDLYPGIRVPEPYQAMVSLFCMEKNARQKIGNLCLDRGDGMVYVHLETSFCDGAVEGRTLDRMERVAMNTLRGCLEDLERLSHGMLPPRKIDDDDRMKQIMAQIDRDIERMEREEKEKKAAEEAQADDPDPDDEEDEDDKDIDMSEFYFSVPSDDHIPKGDVEELLTLLDGDDDGDDEDSTSRQAEDSDAPSRLPVPTEDDPAAPGI